MAASTANPAIAVACVPFLDRATCEAVIARAEAGGWDAGRLGAAGAAGAPDVRRCRVSAAVDPALAERVVAYAAALTRQVNGFDLTGARADDPPLVMRYDAGDHFVWHVDNGVATEPVASRKVGFTVQLSPRDAYAGGDLEIAMYAQAYATPQQAARTHLARQQGTLLAFPAFHLHRITPVTRGTRYALVGWLHGPPFR